MNKRQALCMIFEKLRDTEGQVREDDIEPILEDLWQDAYDEGYNDGHNDIGGE